MKLREKNNMVQREVRKQLKVFGTDAIIDNRGQLSRSNVTT
ncbi:MAG: hypothetical protein ACM3UL_02975 [Ignavibacteria bacterium]